MMKKHYVTLMFVGITMTGCARTPQQADPDLPREEVQLQTDGDSLPGDVGKSVEKQPTLDRTQETVFNVVNGATQRFDSFFGSTDMDTDARVSRGRISVGHQWDQRNGSKTRLRLKARFDLRALGERTQFLLGRGDTDDLIDGTGDDNIDNLPNRFNDFEDDDWLIGVGFSRDQRFRRGWDFSVGVKLSTPLEPYARATYRWLRSDGDRWLWQVRPRVFVQSQRGIGASVNNTVDYAASKNWLLRSWTIALGEDDIAGLGWTQKFTAYHSISDKNAMAYALFATGQTDADVPLQDYGIELRYRKRIAREWLFVEFLTYLSWPREFLVEERERNLGVGIEFEMQFGDWPGRPQNRSSR